MSKNNIYERASKIAEYKMDILVHNNEVEEFSAGSGKQYPTIFDLKEILTDNLSKIVCYETIQDKFFDKHKDSPKFHMAPFDNECNYVAYSYAEHINVTENEVIISHREIIKDIKSSNQKVDLKIYMSASELLKLVNYSIKKTNKTRLNTKDSKICLQRIDDVYFEKHNWTSLHKEINTVPIFSAYNLHDYGNTAHFDNFYLNSHY